MNDEPQPAQLDISRLPKGLDEVGFVQSKQMLECGVRNISCRDVQELSGSPLEEVRGYKIAVLANQDAIVAVAKIAQAVIWRAVSLGKIEGVNRVMPALMQRSNEPARQLGVNEHSHGACASMLLTRLIFAANANTARMSSRSRS